MKIYFEADKGIDGVIPTAEPEAQQAAQPAQPEAQPEQKPEVPAWLSQLPKELREDKEKAGRISTFKTIADLANEFIKADDERKTALHLPTKDSTDEEVKAFFTRLGVPEKAEDYALSDYDLDPEAIKKSKEIFMAAAHKSALSKKQAANMWQSQVALYKAVSQINEAQAQKVKDSFEPAYNKLLEAEYPEATERDKAIKGELAVVTKWTQEQGIGQKLIDSGLVYDAEFMHKLADYIKSNSPGQFIQGKGGEPPKNNHGGAFDNYSEDFLKAVGE